jgi:hypothetical protein
VARALEGLIGFYAPLQEQPGPIVRAAATVGQANQRLQLLRDALDEQFGSLEPDPVQPT